MKMIGFVNILILLLNGGIVTSLDSMKNDVYFSLPNAKFCVQRANQHKIFGCSSSFAGSTGKLKYLSDSEVYKKWLMSQKNTKEILVISETLLDREKIMTITLIPSVTGMIILAENPKKLVFGFSPEDTFEHSLPSKGEFWNKNGINIIETSFPFPIVLISDQDEKETIFECINDAYTIRSTNLSNFLNFYGDCTGRIRSFMLSNKLVAEKCLSMESYSAFSEPRLCQPFQVSNIYVDMQDKPPSDPKSKRILVTSTMDFRSLFNSLEGAGVESELSGAIIWLSLLDTLNRSTIGSSEENSLKIKNKFLFTLFDGEHWDNMGSSGFVNKLKNTSLFLKHSNISFNDIEAAIELNQLGLTSTSSIPTYIHYDNHVSSVGATKSIQNFITMFKNSQSAAGVTFEDSNKDDDMPPFTSSKPFFKSGAKFPWLLFSDYSLEFMNDFFHHVHDNLEYTEKKASLVTKNLTEILTARSYGIAAGLLQMAGFTKEEAISHAKPNVTLISELIDCMGRSMNCSLARRLYFPESIKTEFQNGKPLTRDIHVMDYQNRQLNPPSSYVAFFTRVSAFIIGRKYNCHKTDDRPSCKAKHVTNDSFELSFVTPESVLINASVYVMSFSSKDLFDLNLTEHLYTESSWLSTSVMVYHSMPVLFETVLFLYGSSVCFIVMVATILLTKFKVTV